VAPNAPREPNLLLGRVADLAARAGRAGRAAVLVRFGAGVFLVLVVFIVSRLDLDDDLVHLLE